MTRKLVIRTWEKQAIAKLEELSPTQQTPSQLCSHSARHNALSLPPSLGVLLQQTPSSPWNFWPSHMFLGMLSFTTNQNSFFFSALIIYCIITSDINTELKGTFPACTSPGPSHTRLPSRPQPGRQPAQLPTADGETTSELHSCGCQPDCVTHQLSSRFGSRPHLD